MEFKIKQDENNYKTILKNYKFKEKDTINLKSVQNIIIKFKDNLLKGFYEFIFEFNHTQKLLHNEEILERHKKGIKQCYITKELEVDYLQGFYSAKLREFAFYFKGNVLA